MNIVLTQFFVIYINDSGVKLDMKLLLCVNDMELSAIFKYFTDCKALPPALPEIHLWCTEKNPLPQNVMNKYIP